VKPVNLEALVSVLDAGGPAGAATVPASAQAPDES